MGNHNHSVPLSAQSPSELPALSKKSKKRPALTGLFLILVYRPSLSVYNIRAHRPSAEVMNIVANYREYKRQKPGVAFSGYLPLAHIELACHRSRTPAPHHLYRNPMYFEMARLLCIVSVHNRLTCP